MIVQHSLLGFPGQWLSREWRATHPHSHDGFAGAEDPWGDGPLNLNLVSLSPASDMLTASSQQWPLRCQV